MSHIFQHVPHPHIEARKQNPPEKATDQAARGKGPVGRFNAFLAVHISNGVGTMWCAYVFTGIALISLPAALKSGDKIIIVSWVAQTFLQLVLLSIIIVGQNIQSASSDKRAQATYEDADAVLHEALQIQAHLEAQDEFLKTLVPKA